MIEQILAYACCACLIKGHRGQHGAIGGQEEIAIYRGIDANKKICRHAQRNAHGCQDDNGRRLAEQQYRKYEQAKGKQRYADGDFRDVLFYPEDVDGNLEREYNLGR